MDAIKRGKEVVRIEAEAVRALENKINGAFAGAVDLIEKINGRVVITGYGEIGPHRAQDRRDDELDRNSCNLSCTPAMRSMAIWEWSGRKMWLFAFRKAAIPKKSFNLVPMFKRIGVPVISIIGNKDSKLGRESEFVLDASVEQEACPYDLAPTASTTAALVIGDALALALLDRKNFTEEEFAMFHPGGNIGKRLFLKVEELMVKGQRYAEEF